MLFALREHAKRYMKWLANIEGYDYGSHNNQLKV
jgi:hypothetical protein